MITLKIWNKYENHFDLCMVWIVFSIKWYLSIDFEYVMSHDKLYNSSIHNSYKYFLLKWTLMYTCYFLSLTILEEIMRRRVSLLSVCIARVLSYTRLANISSKENSACARIVSTTTTHWYWWKWCNIISRV